MVARNRSIKEPAKKTKAVPDPKNSEEISKNSDEDGVITAPLGSEEAIDASENQALSYSILDEETEDRKTMRHTLYSAGEFFGKRDTKVSNTIQHKEVGLALSIVGIAELASERLLLNSAALDMVQDRMFTKDFIQGLNKDELFEMFRLLNSNVETLSKRLSEIGKSLNWDNLKDTLAVLEASDADTYKGDPHQMQASVMELIKVLHDGTEVFKAEDSDYSDEDAE